MMQHALWLATMLMLFTGLKPCEAVDIRLTSATTKDSSYIRFAYEVVAGPLMSATVPVRVYRSADATFEPLVDTLLVEGMLKGLATGEHAQDLVIPASGLALSPAQPYFFVVVDLPTADNPQGVVLESNEDNNATMFRKYSLAVIVHGLTFYDVPPAWVDLMATALIEEGYDAVLPADWAVISHAIRTGVPQEFGATLVDDVLDRIAEMELGPQDRVDVHWIGHSRGMVVVSQSLLVWSQTTNLPATVSGGWVKVTALDPHPAKNRPAKLMSVNHLNPLGPLLAFGTGLFQAIANDPDVVLPTALIDESELFFQRAEWYILSPQEVYFDYLANYWGEAPLPGFALDKTFNITQPRLSHFEVPNFYIDVVLRAGQSQPSQINLVRKSKK